MGKPKISGHMVTFDKRTVEVCSMAGINILSKEMIRISSLKDAFSKSLKEVESERNFDRFMVNIGLTLSLTKALCDATIEIAGAMGPPPVKALAKVYGETQDYIEFRQAATSGNNYDAGKYLAKKAAGLGGEKVADVVDLQMVSVDGIRAAVTGNGVDSAKSIADYGVKLTEMGAKYKNASPQTIQYIDQGKAVIKAGFALYKVYEEYADMKLSDENFEKMRKVQMATINTFDAQINGLLKVIVECGKQRGIKEPSSSSIPDLKMPYKGPTIGSARR